MNILRTIFFCACVSVLHYAATFICLFQVIFARWHRSEMPPGTEAAVSEILSSVMLRLFSFPVLLAAETLYDGLPPDKVIYLFAAMNSCLWGFSIIVLWNYKAQLFGGLKDVRLRNAIK